LEDDPVQKSCGTEKKAQIVYLLFCFAFLSVSLVCIILQSESRFECALWALPVTFTFFYLVTGKHVSYRENSCLVVLYAVMTIRYVVIPLSAYAAGWQQISVRNSDNLNQAIILSLWEMIWVFLAIIYYLYLKPQLRGKSRNSDPENREVNISNWSVGLVVLASIVVLCLHPSLLGSSDILWGKVDSNLLKINSGVSGAFSILWGVGRSFIYIGLLNIAVRKYRRTKKYQFVIFAAVLTLIFTASIYTGGIRVARWGMAIAFLSSFFLLSSCFPEHKMSISLFVFVPVIILLLAATFYKNLSSNINSGMGPLSAFQKLFDFDLLNAYFGGFKNVSYALVMVQSFHSSISNFFSDCLRNMPYVSNYIDPAQTTTYLFNRAVYGFFPANDRVVPIIGQGLSYFGVFFSPILSVLSVVSLFHFNALSKKSKSLYLKYIYIYAGYFFSVFMCLNLSIILSVLYSTVIPFCLLILLNKFQFRQRNLEYEEHIPKRKLNNETAKP
jgi:hypothetical protein